ncbi:hypothetical protein HIM_10066 [Hirsutella minnesotensis 3608]|uniref:Uncharacterized protein n=1 Tax=Hirsutella minnesotensis 3608 TaxID=1043627 RepID=A0A0F7ZXD3_9HYPO|nr:hypothetical protein HIM_10066 [Hirsutella minnesotensis 3608]
MAYYDTIRHAAVFAKQASAEKMENFESLYKAPDFACGVSGWGRKHLFASRVLCSEPERRLPLFSKGELFPLSCNGVHVVIDGLVNGPQTPLMKMREPQIVRQYQPDSLGYIWAALAQLLQKPQSSDQSSDRPVRERVPVNLYGNPVSSSSIQIGSSSPTRPESASTESSIGFVQELASPVLPVEDLTVRLASRFIRCVVNYAQDIWEPFPCIYFRDQRRLSSFRTLDGQKVVRAIDDGGLLLDDGEEAVQIAGLEGKRYFRSFAQDGVPTVSDQTLAQIVGQALAVGRTGEVIVAKDIISILVIRHYIKFIHVTISDEYLNTYEKLDLAAWGSTTAPYLTLDSTDWFDIGMADHRKEIISHILAIMNWANANY